MRLWRGKGSTQAAPATSAPDHHRDNDNLGYYLDKDLGRRFQQAVLGDLKQLSHASAGSRQEIEQAFDSLHSLSLELSAVVAELKRTSSGELSGALAASRNMGSFIRNFEREKVFSAGQENNSEELRRQVAAFRDHSSKRVEKWGSDNLPQEAQASFGSLVGRYRQLTDSVFEGYTGLISIANDLKQALRKERIIEAARAINPEIGRGAGAERALENIGAAKLTAAAISQGLDEAYELAETRLGRPFLNGLEQSTPPTQAETVEAEGPTLA